MARTVLVVLLPSAGSIACLGDWPQQRHLCDDVTIAVAIATSAGSRS